VNIKKAAGAVIAVGIAGFVGYRFVNGSYLEKRAEIESKISAAETWIERAEKELDGRRRLRRDMQVFIDRSLGQTPEVVEHRLRASLNELGERNGLVGLAVDTSMREGVASPATARVREFSKEMRELPDFHRAEATIRGTGTLEQALRTLYELQQLPYLSRVDRFDFTPKNNGEWVDMRATLTVLYFRDLPAPDALAMRTDAPPFDRYLALAERNAFRIPPEPKPVEVAQAPPPEDPKPKPKPAPPPPPYHDWRVTGVTTTSTGPMLFVVNQKNNAMRELRVRDRVLGAVFVGLGAGAEEAIIEIDGQAYSVRLGGTLAERTPVADASKAEGASSATLGLDVPGAQDDPPGGSMIMTTHAAARFDGRAASPGPASAGRIVMGSISR
jgi:hypothetical protein